MKYIDRLLSAVTLSLAGLGVYLAALTSAPGAIPAGRLEVASLQDQPCLSYIFGGTV